MNEMRSKDLIKTALRRIRPVRDFLDATASARAHLPRPVSFMDGSRRICYFRKVQELLGFADAYPELGAEARIAFDTYRGGDFIDVGAFHGWYSVLLSPKAQAGDTFVLIEPDRRALPVLHETVAELARLFPSVKYFVLPCAAGDGSAVQIEYPTGADGHPRVGGYPAHSQGDESAEKSVVLDSLIEVMGLKPTVLKVDVEGAEWHVLGGVKRSIQRFAPDILLEIHPRWQPGGVLVSDLMYLLKMYGYENNIVSSSEICQRLLCRKVARPPDLGREDPPARA
jgi:FkbM family methyltransferase